MDYVPEDMLGREEEPEPPIALRKPMQDDVEMDITPMIDIVFLLLIFFIVCSTAASQVAVDLPPARYGKGVSEQNSVVFSVEAGEGRGPAAVYVGDVAGERLPDDLDAQEEMIREEVERGVAGGKTDVVIKAARDVKHKEVSRVGAAVGQVEGIRLHMAVLEVE